MFNGVPIVFYYRFQPNAHHESVVDRFLVSRRGRPGHTRARHYRVFATLSVSAAGARSRPIPVFVIRSWAAGPGRPC